MFGIKENSCVDLAFTPKKFNQNRYFSYNVYDKIFDSLQVHMTIDFQYRDKKEKLEPGEWLKLANISICCSI
jgi:hypothetical protein